MDRRKFFNYASKAGMGLIAIPYWMNGSHEATLSDGMDEITISEISARIRSGQLNIKDLVQYYLNRIEEIDRRGPSLNSIITVNPDAIDIANKLDNELRDGRIRGPLHGIPVILKDNIDTGDMPTTAGSRALAGSVPKEDSTVAAKLRAAGAVIIAKANLSEWANFRGQRSTSGWSGYGGLTKNPYILDRNACGSSSGSGVSVSANLCVIAIGTETNGSIVCPSTANGVVGIKPTVGLLSRAGIIPISFTQDTAGPMARTVRDAAICLGTMTGVDERDSKTLGSIGNYYHDYTPFLNENGLEGKRLGYYKGLEGRHPKVDQLMKKTMNDLSSLGAEIIEIDAISLEEVSSSSFQIMLYEYKDGLNKYFASLGDNAPIKNVEELIAFNEKDGVELLHFGQEYLKMAQEKGDLKTQDYLDHLEKMLTGRRENGIDRVMGLHGLDAIVAPTGGPAWKTDLVNGDSGYIGSSSPAAQAGYPNVTVPMGFIDELPVGVSFFGRAWSEPVLIEAAYAYEQATKHRKAPRFLPH